ncbi:hypothetical protein ACFQYP_53805 [Nonomuraea antimicrobica]|uniref:hypothetical protein n=1 Tax=Nonomuraea antimicrobica TaxID=561173 RepID=UPI0031EE8141
MIRGETAAPPAATLWIAVGSFSGLAFLGKKPEAAALSPTKAYPSRSKSSG